MSRYIDADVTLETLKELLFKTAINNVGYTRDVDEVCKDIADNRLSVWMEYVPSADVVEVVRCKDCVYKRIQDDGITHYYYCALEDRPNRQWSVDDTDFCSWGERKEDAN